MYYFFTVIFNVGIPFFQVFEGYGQTETTAGATLQLMGDPTIGKKSTISYHTSPYFTIPYLTLPFTIPY
jgi:hypothetical protein